ncbi:hypothetical protein E2C01_020093 [Portunus trituberculatus]|uniref:Uncharacterized protein n=1 Tax=Portunus trituberculatus TaxID=210409 RepID=A0A5B7DZ29_PORTR|nr:hypothetical protein [Portunus trituberculatus]
MALKPALTTTQDTDSSTSMIFLDLVVPARDVSFSSGSARTQRVKEDECGTVGSWSFLTRVGSGFLCKGESRSDSEF